MPLYDATMPALPMQAYGSRRKCGICDLRAATKLTYADIAAPDSPAFWCEDCYKMLHYTKDDKLLDPDHKVFPYQIG